jgi:hypothetical protein
MITRLFAMYQQSRKVLIFLVVVFLSITIACGVIAAIEVRHVSGGKVICGRTIEVNQAHEMIIREPYDPWQLLSA